MPISPDPGDTFAITFPEDAGKPEAEQRRIVCRQLTYRQLLAMQRQYEEAWASSENDAKLAHALAATLAIAAIRLEGAWTTPGDVTVDSLIDSLTPADFEDVIQRLCAQSLLSGLERKKSARQSQSSMAASVPAAAV